MGSTVRGRFSIDTFFPLMNLPKSLFPILLALAPCLSGQLASPVQIDEYIKASNSASDHRFGNAIAMDGNTLVVGAVHEDGGSTGVNGDQTNQSIQNSGAVYVFVRVAGTWSLEANIKASTTDPDDAFGSAVAIAGDVLVVGTPREQSLATGVDSDQSDNSGFACGAAYVFERSAGTWTQTAYLKPSHIDIEDDFGAEVAVSGGRIAVGAPREDGIRGDPASNGNQTSGAVFLFERAGSSWTQTQYLKGSDSTSGDRFGTALHIEDDHIFVGAIHDEFAPGVLDTGMVYEFEFYGVLFHECAQIVPAQGESGDRFGSDIDVHGPVLVIAASFERGAIGGVDGDELDNLPMTSGAGYVFRRSASGWVQEAYLKHEHPGLSDVCSSIGAGENFAVLCWFLEGSEADGIGGDPSDDTCTQSGGAYVYSRTSNGWLVSEYLKHPDSDPFDKFGLDVAVHGGLVVVGAPFEDGGSNGFGGDPSDNSTIDAGCVVVYEVDVFANALVSHRTAGANVESYTSSLMILGSTWNAGVDLSVTGHALALVVGFLAPTHVVLPTHYVLLTGANFPHGEVLNLAPQLGPQASFQVGIPSDTSLAGIAVSTQAVHFGGIQPLALSNAIDLVLGT